MSTLLRNPRFGLFGAVLFASACGAAGPYGYAREYAPLDAEDEHFDATEESQASLEDVKRDPRAFADREIGWFGVVTGIADRSDHKTRLTLSLRAHQPRHLCTTEEQKSCRVTVSERDMGAFTIDLALKPAELDGPERIWFGSLLKVYGRPTGEYDDEGGPQIAVTYYRHFPRGKYVTTASRGAMRR